MKEWIHSDTWFRRGRDFGVEVHRHRRRGVEDFEGRHGWCVYAYIYPAHPHFKNFEGERPWQNAALALPLHGGPTLLQYLVKEKGEVSCVKVGCDYQHLGDESYCHDATREDASRQFHDAEELFQWLDENNTKEPEP